MRVGDGGKEDAVFCKSDSGLEKGVGCWGQQVRNARAPLPLDPPFYCPMHGPGNALLSYGPGRSVRTRHWHPLSEAWGPIL